MVLAEVEVLEPLRVVLVEVVVHHQRQHRVAEKFEPFRETEKRHFLVVVSHCHDYFVEEKFEGNRDNYFDPRNSYLNEVIDRKKGLPDLARKRRISGHAANHCDLCNLWNINGGKALQRVRARRTMPVS